MRHWSFRQHGMLSSRAHALSYQLELKSALKFSMIIPPDDNHLHVPTQSGSAAALQPLRLFLSESTSRAQLSGNSALYKHNSRLSWINTTQVYVNINLSLSHTPHVYMNSKFALPNKTPVSLLLTESTSRTQG